MIDLKNLLPIALQAAREASNKILEVYNSNDFQTEAKGDNSPLTLADKKAHQAIVAISIKDWQFTFCKKKQKYP